MLSVVANELAARGHCVHVINLDEPSTQPFYTFSDNVKLHNMGLSSWFPESRILKSLRMMRKATELQGSIVIGFLPSSFVILSALFFLRREKFIASEHIVRDWYKGQPLKYLFVSIAGNISDGFSFISSEIAEEYGLIYEAKKLVLDNPIRLISSRNRRASAVTKPKPSYVDGITKMSAERYSLLISLVACATSIRLSKP